MIPGEGGNQPAPGEVERLVMHCVANGADATFFFRWRACPFGCEQSHGTLTDYDGRPKRVYAEAQRVYERLARLDETLAGTTVQSDVGVLLDFPTRWVMETGVRWNGPRGLYTGLCRKLFRAARANGVNCDAVGRDGEFGEYKLLIVPALATMDDRLAARFRAFVEGGGTLVWHPLSGIKDEEATIYPARLHPEMKRLLGADITDFATAGPDEAIPFTWSGREYHGTAFCDLPVLQGAGARGEFTKTWYQGTPAVTEARAGKGSAVYVMTYASDEFYRDLLGLLLSDAAIPRILGTDLPAGVEVAERRAGNRRLVFLLNANASEVRIVLPQPMRDVYHEEDVEVCTWLPPFGVRVLMRP
jgi:beta-galactosidase